jgi:hypothetical protein
LLGLKRQRGGYKRVRGMRSKGEKGWRFEEENMGREKDLYY